MNKKLTILDIADLVSSKSGVTKKESEQFVKEFFSLASEIISSGESLTIKGVGAFVPVWVEARTSVDVNTKQPIEIPGHYKLSFTPDKTMRDAVNAPFAAFTTEVVEVDMPEMVEIKEEEILDEVVELEPSDESIEIVEMSEVNEEKTEEVDIEDVQLEIIETENGEVVEEQKTVEENQTNEAVSTSETYTQIVTAPAYIQDEEEIQKEYKRRTRNGYIFGFLTALLLFVVLVSVWLFFFKGDKGLSFSFSSFKLTTTNEQTTEQELSNEVINEQENNIDSMIVEPNEKVVIENASSSTTKYLVIETIQRGKFLTTIAEKHYGNKAFWVYIYRENSGRIWNPRDLKAGFKVVVPAAEKYGIDASDPKSVNKAKELEKQILYEIE